MKELERRKRKREYHAWRTRRIHQVRQGFGGQDSEYTALTTPRFSIKKLEADDESDAESELSEESYGSFSDDDEEDNDGMGQ